MKAKGLINHVANKNKKVNDTGRIKRRQCREKRPALPTLPHQKNGEKIKKATFAEGVQSWSFVELGHALFVAKFYWPRCYGWVDLLIITAIKKRVSPHSPPSFGTTFTPKLPHSLFIPNHSLQKICLHELGHANLHATLSWRLL